MFTMLIATHALLGVSSRALAADWASGETIPEAATVDITPQGFEAIAALIPALIPSSIEIPDTSDSGGYWCVNYAYALVGGWVGIQVIDANIVPGNGVLDISADLLVNVNDVTDPFILSYELFCGETDCGGYVIGFPVHFQTTMALEIVTASDGSTTLDATVGTPNVTYELSGDDIVLDCFIQDIEDVLGYLGLSLYELIIDQVAGQLDSAVADLGPTLETTIEEAFASANIDQDLDLNGVAAHVKLYPSDVVIEPSGVRLTMAGSMSADAATCVAPYDPGTSLKTLSNAPSIGVAPSGVDSPFHLGLALSDDFANEAMYSLWRGGLLCFSLAPDNDSFPLDSSILNMLTGDAFSDLFPADEDAKPMSLTTVPRAAPTVEYTGSHAIDVQIHDLDLELAAELDGRMSRMVAVTLNGPVGVDPTLDGTTGNLAIALDINPLALDPTVTYNEFVPEASAAIESSFGTSLAGVLDTVLGGLLGELAFALPSSNGIGLQDLQMAAAGTNGDWLGAYAWIGAVTYESSSGCGGCGGTTDSGSSSSESCGGCSTGEVPTAWTLVLPFGLLLGLRRRG
ncbi:MAG: hypothetical protein EXR69_16425 [Myxococcales bacterium]|nr:hypothetical protein [Myxococcales bacterium]